MYKLYQVSRNDTVLYDEVIEIVVYAKNGYCARAAAAEQCGDEGSDVWMDSNKSTCKQLTEKSLTPKTVVRSFNAG